MCCNHPKQGDFTVIAMPVRPDDAGGIANSVDPDQTVCLGAV